MHLQLHGMEAHLSASLRLNGAPSSVWQDINVTEWTIRIINVPIQDDKSVNNISYCFSLLIPNMLLTELNVAVLCTLQVEEHPIIYGRRVVNTI